MTKVLQAFRAGQLSQADLLRALVGYADWRVQMDEGGQPEIVPDDRGTQFVIAESDVDQGQVVSGRSLVNELAPSIGGIAFDPEADWGLLWRPERLPELQQWSQIVELEQALLKPGPNQVSTLLNGPWWGVVEPGQTELATFRQEHREGGEYRFSLNAVTLLTAPDAVETFRVTQKFRKLEAIALDSEFWQNLASRADYAGICVNPLTPRYVLLPPHLPAALVAGRDVRPGAGPLPARTLAEIELWLDLMGARPDRRSHQIQPSAGGLTVAYEAWWGYEPRPLLFTLPASSSEVSGAFGETPSEILCAGLMVRYVRGKLAGLPRFRWQANADQRQRAAKALRVVNDLSQFIEAGRIPFAAIRTPQGAELWRLEPDAFTASAIAKLQQRAEALA
ncbi:hypothetical protein DYY88_02020 [Leptolyngbya iicbica LK]|uniref:Uncharacterized protein n=3 Tax=Cyanophyceae TaxID=3028117 RepID=A0A4Q7EGJ2_9CYAN|nr:hypothetical protein DYY88_02020 [Leptolyngbya sp. LK]